MADRYPKSLEELTAENQHLRADVQRLQSSVGSLQAQLVAKDAEIAKLRNPKKQPRILDPEAEDAFARPYTR